MQAIAYYVTLPFLYLISLLPSPLLYLLSDLVFFLLYHVTGYRKKIVMKNLRNSFPEKPESELNQIMRRFYCYLSDLFLETLKSLTMSKKFAMNHCGFDANARKLFNHYYDQKKSIIVVMGHFGNWEWAGISFSLNFNHQLYALYHPAENSYFNELFIRMRTRFGGQVIPMQDTFREMIRKREQVTATAFIADQTPPPDNAYWTSFLHQDTPVFRGTESIARKLNYPVVYASVNRIRRGYYEIAAETLFEEPANTADGEISEAHIRKLEKNIYQQPETWLWSHRRWKHKRIK